DVMKNLEKEDININLVSAATVQEGVGLRGAKGSANKVKPDLAIAVDAGLAIDTRGMKSSNGPWELGKAPMVLVLDGRNIGHVPCRKHVLAVAKDKDIPVQLQVIPGGGTDAGSFHVSNEGVPSLAIGVPVRYMHSNVSIMHKEDYQNAVKLVTEVVKSLNDDKVAEIIW